MVAWLFAALFFCVEAVPQRRPGGGTRNGGNGGNGGRNGNGAGAAPVAGGAPIITKASDGSTIMDKTVMIK